MWSCVLQSNGKLANNVPPTSGFFKRPDQSPSAAVLVFLAAAAGAGVVAPDFRAGADGPGLGLCFRRRRRFAHDVTGLFAARTAGGHAAAAERARVLVQGLLRDVLQAILT